MRLPILALLAAIPLLAEAADAPRRPPVVLLHGLTNKHPWSDPFLEACLDAWGDGRVYLVFTNSGEAERQRVTRRPLGTRTLVVGGVDDTTAGDDSVENQSRHLAGIIERLQAQHGLDTRFGILAHSMGGLVGRHYIDAHPGTVAGLVTLGTPHQGSPLANDFEWAGLFMGATAAIVDLQPERCAAFNREHPAAKARLSDGGHIFTIEGDGDATDSFGAMGELALGWTILSRRYGTDSDGLVPAGHARLDGATHLASFPGLDHYRLVRDAEVARKAAGALP